MYFTDAPSDEHLGETDCCGFTVFDVYSVAVQIEKIVFIYICVCVYIYIFISKNTTACFAVKSPQVFLQKKRKMNPKQTKNAVLLTVVRGE